MMQTYLAAYANALHDVSVQLYNCNSVTPPCSQQADPAFLQLVVVLRVIPTCPQKHIMHANQSK
jgi:hypothetical protein